MEGYCSEFVIWIDMHIANISRWYTVPVRRNVCTFQSNTPLRWCTLLVGNQSWLSSDVSRLQGDVIAHLPLANLTCRSGAKSIGTCQQQTV